MRRISKSFGASRVLINVDFELHRGEIHALMGENGAGKSTLMKIAAGLIEDFEGEIAVDGKIVHLTSPRAAARAGLAIIHQELSLVPELEVDENIFLGQEKLRSVSLSIVRTRSGRRARFSRCSTITGIWKLRSPNCGLGNSNLSKLRRRL
jgi:ribose transport system ATP-binding protein